METELKVGKVKTLREGLKVIASISSSRQTLPPNPTQEIHPVNSSIKDQYKAPPPLPSRTNSDLSRHLYNHGERSHPPVKSTWRDYGHERESTPHYHQEPYSSHPPYERNNGFRSFSYEEEEPYPRDHWSNGEDNGPSPYHQNRGGRWSRPSARRRGHGRYQSF